MLRSFWIILELERVIDREFTCPSSMEAGSAMGCRAAAEYLKHADALLICTGAGMGVDSGHLGHTAHNLGWFSTPSARFGHLPWPLRWGVASPKSHADGLQRDVQPPLVRLGLPPRVGLLALSPPGLYQGRAPQGLQPALRVGPTHEAHLKG